MQCHEKQQKHASNEKTRSVGYMYKIFRGCLNKKSLWEFCGNSMEIPTGFSVGMGWIWELKYNSHGSPATLASSNQTRKGFVIRWLFQ